MTSNLADTLYIEKRHFHRYLFRGDQPIVSESELQGITKKHLKTSDELYKLKKRRNAKDSKRKTKKPARTKSSSKLPAARRLNETMMSQLDVSCFAKTRRKRFKAPSIENAYLIKYARLVFD